MSNTHNCARLCKCMPEVEASLYIEHETSVCLHQHATILCTCAGARLMPTLCTAPPTARVLPMRRASPAPTHSKAAMMPLPAPTAMSAVPGQSGCASARSSPCPHHVQGPHSCLAPVDEIPQPIIACTISHIWHRPCSMPACAKLHAQGMGLHSGMQQGGSTRVMTALGSSTGSDQRMARVRAEKLNAQHASAPSACSTSTACLRTAAIVFVRNTSPRMQPGKGQAQCRGWGTDRSRDQGLGVCVPIARVRSQRNDGRLGVRAQLPALLLAGALGGARECQRSAAQCGRAVLAEQEVATRAVLHHVQERGPLGTQE